MIFEINIIYSKKRGGIPSTSLTLEREPYLKKEESILKLINSVLFNPIKLNIYLIINITINEWNISNTIKKIDLNMPKSLL